MGASKDRDAIRKLRKGMVADLNKNIVRAIQLGEAKAKAVQERAMENIATEPKALLTTISSSVENMADNVFKAVQEDRHKIADNFLSLKAYASTAADKIADYLAKGKGRNLASIGDLLQSVASRTTTSPLLRVGLRLRRAAPAVLRQGGQGRQLHLQDQRSGERVHRDHGHGQGALADGHWQVPPVQA